MKLISPGYKFDVFAGFGLPVIFHSGRHRRWERTAKFFLFRSVLFWIIFSCIGNSDPCSSTCLDSISGLDTLTYEERKHYLGSCRSSDFKISINYYRVGIYRWNYLVYFYNIKLLATSYYSIVRNNYILSENGLFTQGALDWYRYRLYH